MLQISFLHKTAVCMFQKEEEMQSSDTQPHKNSQSKGEMLVKLENFAKTLAIVTFLLICCMAALFFFKGNSNTVLNKKPAAGCNLLKLNRQNHLRMQFCRGGGERI